MEGAILKRLRQENRISISQLSKMTGISKSYLSLIERGIQKNPSLDILEKLAKSFQMEVNDLVKQDGNAQYNIKRVIPSKSVVKVEIELSEDQLNPKVFNQIKEFIKELHSDKDISS